VKTKLFGFLQIDQGSKEWRLSLYLDLVSQTIYKFSLLCHKNILVRLHLAGPVIGNANAILEGITTSGHCSMIKR